MKMEGIVHGFPRRGLSRTQVFEPRREGLRPQPNSGNARRRPAFDEQFFVEFIRRDLEALERMFSEEQLRGLAQELGEGPGSSGPTDSKDEEQLSSVSINTVEFNARKNPQSESNSKHSNEERAAAKIVKKKTRNTMIPEGSDLSISNFQDNDEFDQKIVRAKQDSAVASSNELFLAQTSVPRTQTDARQPSQRAQAVAEALVKERPVKTQKTFGSSRILPIDLESFDARTAHKLSKIRHGAHTMYKNDDIQVDQSVLNSRFLISDFLDKKQKIYLLKEKFDFNRASEDIFEQRDEQAKARRREEARRNATDYKKDWGIRPFQKKLVLKSRPLAADEEQAECLRHLGLEPSELERLVQQEYNHPYLSNLLVTGTLSLALRDKALGNDKNNRTRRVQNAELQNTEQTLNRSLSQSSYVQQQSNPLYSQQSSPPPKQASARSQAVSVRQANDADQLAKELKQTVFIKAMHTQSLARSKNRALASGVQQSLTSLREKSGISLDNLAKKRALLQKQAAKDPALQRRLILSAINREAKNSRLFMTVYNKRRNRITEGELRHRPTLVGMLDIAEDDEDKDSGKDEDEDSEEDEFGDVFQDAFLDWPVDGRVEVLKAKKQALSGKKNLVQWSGQDVLLDFDPQFARAAVSLVSGVRIWPKALYGYWKRARTPVKALVKSQPFDYFLLAAVFGNTIVLSLDAYGISSAEAAQLSILNTVFTWIFIVEASLKITGLGIVKYLRDKMNYLDLTVVLLSIVEMAFQSGKGNLSAFKAVRIFRIFRVLRVARLLKSMKSMQNILKVLVNSMDQFMYVLMLMFLFNFIYALLGMQIYGGNQYFATNYDGPAGIPMENFDTFNAAFLQVFQVITDENWH